MGGLLLVLAMDEMQQEVRQQPTAEEMPLLLEEEDISVADLRLQNHTDTQNNDNNRRLEEGEQGIV